MQLPIGDQAMEVIALAYCANTPVLLKGQHGIGKSGLVRAAADKLGISCLVRDLSLMEPPDLVGIPHVGAEGCTHFAPPSFLPREGKGLFVLEEVNRCPRYMRVCCLELLTSRRLNDYELPPGWVPVASINPAADNYEVDELDPALLSRFLQLEVKAAVDKWADWARTTGLHEKIIGFVEQSPGVFDSNEPSPRSWEYASRLLQTWEALPDQNRDLLVAALAGTLGDNWALAFMKFLVDASKPLSASEIIGDYPAHRATMKRWIAEAKLDLAAASLAALKRHLQPQRHYDRALKKSNQMRNIEEFLSDLPPDLQRQASAWLEQRGFSKLSVRLGVAS